MISKSQFVSGVFVFLLTSLSLALEPKAQPPIYRPVNTSDLLGGYIRNEEWIEVDGHVWFSDQGVFFNADQSSARVPIRVDVVNVNPENSRRLQSECGAPDQFRGGCWVVIRGQTGMLGGRQGILARDVQIIARP
jgi:hypothetical protein